MTPTANLPGSFRIVVPATSANLGPGFDVLGLALSLYNTATVIPISEGREGVDAGAGEPAGRNGQPAAADSVLPVIESLEGEGAGVLPKDETNLFVRSMLAYAEHVGAALPSCRLRLENRIPLARGLGSSAATIVCGLASAAVLLGRPIDRTELLQLATGLEGHPDNVAAAIYGGLTIAYSVAEQSVEPMVEVETVRPGTVELEPAVRAHKLTPAPGLRALLLIPSEELSTEEARGALADQVPRADAVFNIARCALLVAAIATGDYQRLPDAVEDRLHQPQRLPLLPLFSSARETLAACGIAAVALSGAGPTMIAFVSSAGAEAKSAQVKQALAEGGLPLQVLLCAIVSEGVKVEQET